jgi:LytS/YehU family sensor histidine kinase
MRVEVPSLILQPLLENAVTTAADAAGRGRGPSIVGKRVGDMLQNLSPQPDPGPAGLTGEREGQPHGLDNIRQRLEAGVARPRRIETSSRREFGPPVFPADVKR